MIIRFLSAALVSFLTGAVALYAYYNRNRYIDLILTTIATFMFGSAMLLSFFSILPGMARFLLSMSEVIFMFAILFLVIRLGTAAAKTLSDIESESGAHEDNEHAPNDKQNAPDETDDRARADNGIERDNEIDDDAGNRKAG